MQSEKNKIGYYLERTTRLVKLNFHKKFKNAGLSITPEQWVILDMLNTKDGISQSEIAEMSFKDAPSISRIVDVLVNKKYVERRNSADDRRKFEIYLTEEGFRLVQKTIPIVNDLREKSWKNLNEKDYQEFLRIINQVFTNMDS